MNLCTTKLVEDCQDSVRINLRVNDQTMQLRIFRAKREPVNGVKNHMLDKSHNCGKLKPNHWDQCKAKNITCNNCSCRGHFARFCKKSSFNQVDGTYEFTQCERNVIRKLEKQDEEEFGVF